MLPAGDPTHWRPLSSGVFSDSSVLQDEIDHPLNDAVAQKAHVDAGFVAENPTQHPPGATLLAPERGAWVEPKLCEWRVTHQLPAP